MKPSSFRPGQDHMLATMNHYKISLRVIVRAQGYGEPFYTVGPRNETDRFSRAMLENRCATSSNCRIGI